MNLFFAPTLLLTDSFTNLDQQESHHCLHSLRFSVGDTILLTNGDGIKAEGIISEADGKKCIVQIMNIEKIQKQSFYLEIAVAPTKNHNRFEWFVEKASEIGIDIITPLICSRSERKHLQTDRLSRLVIAAMKQSLRYIFPVINPETTFSALVNKKFNGKKFIAVCDKEEKPRLNSIIKKNENVQILIGPEGDFSEEEVNLAITRGYTPISLGKNRLRTETAAIAACHIFNLIND